MLRVFFFLFFFQSFELLADNCSVKTRRAASALKSPEEKASEARKIFKSLYTADDYPDGAKEPALVSEIQKVLDWESTDIKNLDVRGKIKFGRRDAMARLGQSLEAERKSQMRHQMWGPSLSDWKAYAEVKPYNEDGGVGLSLKVSDSQVEILKDENFPYPAKSLSVFKKGEKYFLRGEWEDKTQSWEIRSTRLGTIQEDLDDLGNGAKLSDLDNNGRNVLSSRLSNLMFAELYPVTGKSDTIGDLRGLNEMHQDLELMYDDLKTRIPRDREGYSADSDLFMKDLEKMISRYQKLFPAAEELQD